MSARDIEETGDRRDPAEGIGVRATASAAAAAHTRSAARASAAAAATAAATAALVPWTVHLAATLPGRFKAHHWNTAWVGFDVALIAVLAVTAWAMWLRPRVLPAAAVVAATLLAADAWFDVVTSWGTSDQAVTIATAVFAELPLAAFLLWLRARSTRVGPARTSTRSRPLAASRGPRNRRRLSCSSSTSSASCAAAPEREGS